MFPGFRHHLTSLPRRYVLAPALAVVMLAAFASRVPPPVGKWSGVFEVDGGKSQILVIDIQQKPSGEIAIVREDAPDAGRIAEVRWAQDTLRWQEQADQWTVHFAVTPTAKGDSLVGTGSVIFSDIPPFGGTVRLVAVRP